MTRYLIKAFTKPEIVFQIIYGALIRGKKIQLKHVNKINRQYLNVGCGRSIASDFINLDYAWIPGIDLCWDITRGIPFRANTITGIYTEHCLEHITLLQCQKVLEDLCRILKPRGILRIIVPDAELYLNLYQRASQGESVRFPYVTDADIKNGFLPMMAINRIFRQDRHLYTYDYRMLKAMLEKAGFINIRREKFLSGRDEKLLIDNERRSIESLYVEAEKPI